MTFLLWVFAFVTAPAALFIVAKNWKSQSPILPYNRWRLVVAGVLSILQIAGIIVFIIAIATNQL